jgi:hypothetical protein
VGGRGGAVGGQPAAGRVAGGGEGLAGGGSGSPAVGRGSPTAERVVGGGGEGAHLVPAVGIFF